MITQIQKTLQKLQPSITSFFHTKTVIQESPRPDDSILNLTQTQPSPELPPSFNLELPFQPVPEFQSLLETAIPETRLKLYADVTNAKTKLSTNLQCVQKIVSD